MTALHRTSDYMKFSVMRRAELKAALPLPCFDSRYCSGVVLPGEVFDVAHYIPLSQGGTNTRQNTGVSHRGCNRREGGKLGGLKTGKRKADREAWPEW